MADDKVIELLIKGKADSTEFSALAASLRSVIVAEAAAKQAAAEMAASIVAAAEATKRLEDISVRGKAVQKLTLDYQRLSAEIRQLATTEGNAALAGQAQANATKQFAIQVAAAHEAAGAGLPKIVKFDDAMSAAGTSAVKSSGSMVNLVRQLNDVGVMAAMGANPLQILAMQGEQIAFAMKEAGFTTAKLATALPALATTTGVIAVVAAAAGTAWAVYGNWAADGAMATERARDAMIDAGREAAALGTALSDAAAKGWEKFKDAASDTNTELLTLTGTIGKATAAANRDVQKLREEAGPALLELGKRQVEITRALNEAVAESNRGGSGAADAAALAADLRPKLAAVTAELKERKAALKDATDNALALGAATDANTAADERARAAAEALAAAKRRQAEAERIAREEAARAREAARLHLASIEAEVAAIGAYYDVLDSGQSIRVSLAEQVDALTAAREAGLDVTRRAAIAEADLALALSQGAISLEEYDRKRKELESGGGSAAGVAGAGRVISSGPSAVVSGIGQAGPWGALIAGIITAIQGGLANLGDLWSDVMADFYEMLSNVGKDLADNIGRWVEDGTNAVMDGINGLVEGLLSNLGTIIYDAIQGAINAVFTVDFWFGLVIAIWEGLGKLLGLDETGDTSTIKQRQKAGIATPAESKGMYASGTNYIAEDGMYRLHKGETVRNRAQTQTDQGTSRRGRARMSGQGGRLTLDIDMDSVGETLTEMQRRGFIAGSAA